VRYAFLWLHGAASPSIQNVVAIFKGKARILLLALSATFAVPNNNVAIGVATDLIGTGSECIGRE
jgi:hypothetical protein